MEKIRLGKEAKKRMMTSGRARPKLDWVGGLGNTGCGEIKSNDFKQGDGAVGSQQSQLQPLSCFHREVTKKNRAAKKSKTGEAEQMLSKPCGRLCPLNRKDFKIRAQDGDERNDKKDTGYSFCL